MTSEKITVRLISDIHLEHHNLTEAYFKKRADICILAGDIGNPSQQNYTDLLSKLSKTHDKVFIITGNHEYYGKKTMSKIDQKIKTLCDEKYDNVHFLQQSTYLYKNVLFMGCTLWSNPNDKTLTKYMNDFTYISNMTYEKYISKHLMHKQWLENELKTFNINKTNDESLKNCVITHHLPSFELINDAYSGDPLNMFFASDVDTTGADVWCFGHTHIPTEKVINNTHFYCNPRGYPGEKTGWNFDYTFEM